jgi:hypothetical protein
MKARIRAGVVIATLLGACAAGLTGCSQSQGETGATAVQTGQTTTPSGQPVPPMSEQHKDKRGE